MKKIFSFLLICATFPVLNLYAIDYEFAWLWADHRKDVYGGKDYRMIADIALDTMVGSAYLDLPLKSLTYNLNYWGEYPYGHEYGKAIFDPPPGDWWKTTYRFRTNDGFTTPLFSHVSTNFDMLDFVEAQIVGGKYPVITWYPIADADNYRVRLYNPSNDQLLFSETVEEDGSPPYSYTYTGDLFSQYDHLWVVLEARDYEGDQLLRRTKNYFDHYATPVGEFIITLRLKNVPESLTFYQDHVPDNMQEYSWGVFIDTDDNPSTGNREGYDVWINLINFTDQGSAPQTMSILNGTGKNTWIIPSGDTWYTVNPIKAEIDYNTNTIVMRAREDFAELADLDITDRFRFKASYYSPTGPVWDETPENLSGSNKVSDDMDDVVYDFIDIIEGEISAIEGTCIGDFNVDKDVDGTDLAEYADDSGGCSLMEFAINYGKINCL